MADYSKKTPQDIRQEKLLAELHITGLIAKPGLLERIGDTAQFLNDTIMNAGAPRNAGERVLEHAARSVSANNERMARHGKILAAADQVAKKRGDPLSFVQPGLPTDGHVAVAVEYLERVLLEHKAKTMPDHFRNMVVPKENPDKAKDLTHGSKPTRLGV